MQPTITRLTQTVKAVTLAEARTHLRMDATDSDGYIETLIDVAHEYVQARLGRTLTTATYRMTLDKFPRRTGAYRNDSSPYYAMPTAYWDFALPLTAVPIELPYPPAAEVTRVAYTRDTDDAVIEMEPGVDYIADTGALPPAIRPKFSRSWPQDCRLYPGSVVVEWTAGYGDASTVPPQVRHAMLMLLTHYFENRSAIADRAGTPVPEAVDALLSSVSAGYYAQIR
jgi:hypothetical protein